MENKMHESQGFLSKIADKVMGAAPKVPKYKVGQTVRYDTNMHQPDWKDGGRGSGKIEKYSNGHYIINGNPVNHFDIKEVIKESEVVRKGKDGRTMMSAAMFLSKAKELANKDPNKKDKKTFKGVGDDHFTQARKVILKTRNVTEEKTVKLSFKDYKQVRESVEAEIDDQIAAATAKLNEAAFDWGKTKPDVSWLHGKGDKSTTKKTDGGLKHTGTYGSETHKAPDKAGKPEEKKSVGRPAGSYGGAYKIDKGARDSKEYKDSLSAKVRAAKAQGFADRAYFKDMMNASLLQHAKNLAKKAESK
jgi:hypothetical protein